MLEAAHGSMAHGARVGEEEACLQNPVLPLAHWWGCAGSEASMG